MRFMFEKGQIYSEVSHDQPIKPRYGYPMPEQIRSMRALQKQDERMGVPRAQSFVKLARLMAGFEDDFQYDKTVSRRCPAYDSLSDIELRGYFGWRTRYKNGSNEPAGSYAEIYMSELLNGISTSDNMDAYEKMCELRDRCGQYISNVDKLIVDFVIFNNLPDELICGNEQFEADRNICAIINRFSNRMNDNSIKRPGTVDAGHNYDSPTSNDRYTNDILDAMIAVSYFFRLTETKLYREEKNDFSNVADRCFGRLVSYYKEKRNRSFLDEMIGRPSIWPYVMFSGAVADASGTEEGYEYHINDVRSVFYKNSHWSVKRYSPDEKKRKNLQDFLAAVYMAYLDSRVDVSEKTADPVSRAFDNAIQEESGLHNTDALPRLKALGISELKTPAWMKKLIEEECSIYFEEKRLAEARKVRIDFSKLDSIREKAAVVRDKLIVDEEIVSTYDVVGNDFFDNNQSKNEAADTTTADTNAADTKTDIIDNKDNGCSDIHDNSNDLLNDLEKRVISAIIQGDDLGFVRPEGKMLSVVIDTVNEKLYDIFGDSVIYDDGTPKIYEEYTDELIEMIK